MIKEIIDDHLYLDHREYEPFVFNSQPVYDHDSLAWSGPPDSGVVGFEVSGSLYDLITDGLEYGLYKLDNRFVVVGDMICIPDKDKEYTFADVMRDRDNNYSTYLKLTRQLYWITAHSALDTIPKVILQALFTCVFHRSEPDQTKKNSSVP